MNEKSSLNLPRHAAPAKDAGHRTAPSETSEASEASEKAAKNAAVIKPDPELGQAEKLDALEDGGRMPQLQAPDSAGRIKRDAVTEANLSLEERRLQLAREMAALDEEQLQRDEADGTAFFYFTSRYPAFVCYVTVRGEEKRVEFKGGMYKTTCPLTKAQLLALPAFHRSVIRYQPEAYRAHLRARVSQERASLENTVTPGSTHAAAGSDAAFAKRDAELAAVEKGLL